MTMKKVLVTVLAMAVLCMMAVGGTLSYFTDTYVEANVMTVGKVEIVQHEQYRTYEIVTVEDGTETIVDLTNRNEGEEAFGLYPYTGEYDALGEPVFYETVTVNEAPYSMLENGMNAVDKIVTIENTGTEAAYIRTIFAFEMKKIVETDDDGVEHIVWVNPIGDVGYLLNEPVVETEDGVEEAYVLGGIFAGDDTVVIYQCLENGAIKYMAQPDDTAEVEVLGAYLIGSYTYPEALAAPVVVEIQSEETGEESEVTEEIQRSISVPSLLQVYLHSHVGNEFYEAVGGEYEVLVLSQGVQTQGFVESVEGAGDVAETALDTAFGKVEAGNESVIAEWFNEPSVEVVEEETVNG